MAERNAQSPLLRLPPEIRNNIYSLVLSGAIIHPDPHYVEEDQSANIYQVARSISSGGHPSPQRFDLLRVCRQIYIETAALPYHLSTFRFLSSIELKIRLRYVPVRICEAIRFVELGRHRMINGLEIDRWAESILMLPNLEHFHVNLCTSPMSAMASSTYLDARHRAMAPSAFVKLEESVAKHEKAGRFKLTYEILQRQIRGGTVFTGANRQHSVYLIWGQCR